MFSKIFESLGLDLNKLNSIPFNFSIKKSYMENLNVAAFKWHHFLITDIILRDNN
tara:strand:- start:15965 stop:16129 length:165 start_codon:yes stop_codon:yes gene_type:complete